MLEIETLIRAGELSRAYENEENKGYSWNSETAQKYKADLNQFLNQNGLKRSFAHQLALMWNWAHSVCEATEMPFVEIKNQYSEFMLLWAKHLDATNQSSMATEFFEKANEIQSQKNQISNTGVSYAA